MPPRLRCRSHGKVIEAKTNYYRLCRTACTNRAFSAQRLSAWPAAYLTSDSTPISAAGTFPLSLGVLRGESFFALISLVAVISYLRISNKYHTIPFMSIAVIVADFGSASRQRCRTQMSSSMTSMVSGLY
jgi:hypothetical protein